MSIVKEAIKKLTLELQEGEVNIITSSDTIKNLLILKYGRKKVEHFGLVLLDQRNVVIKTKALAKGIENRCEIYIKDLMRQVLKSKATGVIIYHNHPAGSAQFSPKDIELTKTIKQLLEYIDVRLLDHILIHGAEASSMKEKTMAF